MTTSDIHDSVRKPIINHVKIMGKVIDLLRSEGININSPYDSENFFAEFECHSKLFSTGRFSHLR